MNVHERSNAIRLARVDHVSCREVGCRPASRSGRRLADQTATPDHQKVSGDAQYFEWWPETSGSHHPHRLGQHGCIVLQVYRIALEHTHAIGEIEGADAVSQQICALGTPFHQNDIEIVAAHSEYQTGKPATRTKIHQ